MTDRYVPAVLRDARLVVGAAITTQAARSAQAAHQLATTPTIALGRLLTAAVLAGLVQERRGELSLQISAAGRLGQLYADATLDGAVRGYVKNTELMLPVFPDEKPEGRRSVAAGVGAGTLVVMRLGDGTAYSHSTTELTSGEVDLDVEHHLTTSDQVPTALACDTLLGAQNEVRFAGGVIIQALPGGDLRRLQRVMEELRGGLLPPLLEAGSAEALLRGVLPEAEVVEGDKTLRWQCRCSEERVRRALATLDGAELADMVDKNEAPTLDCRFCGKRYVVPAEEVVALYEARTRGPLS